MRWQIDWLLFTRRLLRNVVFSPQGLSRIDEFVIVRFWTVMSRLFANSERAARRISPPPVTVPLRAARFTLKQFSIRIASLPVFERVIPSIVAPPLSDTQKTPRPPPRAMISPTRMLVG
nr:hypothetical protein [Streptomyces sp. SM1]